RLVTAASPEVGGLGEQGQAAGEAGDERIDAATERRLRSSGGAGKVAGVSRAGQIDVTGRGLDHEGDRLVSAAAPEVGGLGERGQGSGEADDEGVAAATERRLRPPSGAGKGTESGRAGHVDVTGRGVDREGDRFVHAAPAE